MIGITSFGGYIPRLRLNRMAIYETMGWFSPAIVMVAQGERSFGNWDEDAVTMAVAAARDCLIGQDRAQVDAVYLGSTTLPFADRQCAGVVKTALNLRDDVVTADFTTSLKSGTTALITALSAVMGGERKRVLVSASDMRQTKSATFYEMWFGDGAASLLVGDQDVVAEYKGSYSVSHDFVDHYRVQGKTTDYTWEERWVRDEGYAKILPEAVNGLLQKLDITMDDVDTLVYPCFFKAEHKKIARKLGAAPEKVADNMHEACGETGAAHPLIMLVRALEKAKPGDRILVAGFGQGCDALYFQVTDAIKKLPARTGIEGSLKNKLTTDNYAKFLKFRNLIETDMGIRAEAPTQTALTVLWRKRGLLTGFVGGRCTECGTPQLPKSDICVRPDCKAVGKQEDYPFADQPATIKTFTGDLLAVSVDPPHLYGMVQFSGGGRFMSDFTDCTIDDVQVGQPVQMVFRKRLVDESHGFTNYFWKAVPLPSDVDPDAIRFDGQVAIVTGAGAGLGQAYALDLARRGAKVVVNDLGGAADGTGSASAAADKVVAQIKEAGGEAVANHDSVATPEGAAGIVKTALDTWGRIDVLINNAGILRDKSLAKLQPEDWQSVLAVHLDGAFFATRAALPHLRERGYGRVVLTTSAAGLYGNFGQTNYSAAKMGLIGLMNTLKLEGSKYDIKINTIAPIATTRLTEDLLPPDLKEKLMPEFVVPLVTLLSSDRCSVTGEVFNCGMGYFNRAAVVDGNGTVIGDGKRVPTIEEIHQHWDDISNLEGAKEYNDATSALGVMMDAFTPKAPPDGGDGGGGDQITVAKVFEQMPSAFLADKAGGVDVVFQYELSGAGGGSWYCTIANNECTTAEGKHEQPTTTIKMAVPDFLDLISGKLGAMKAFTTGKLKISGDIMKSQLIEKLFKF